jgi:hypothetical protein
MIGEVLVPGEPEIGVVGEEPGVNLDPDRIAPGPVMLEVVSDSSTSTTSRSPGVNRTGSTKPNLKKPAGVSAGCFPPKPRWAV